MCYRSRLASLCWLALVLGGASGCNTFQDFEASVEQDAAGDTADLADTADITPDTSSDASSDTPDDVYDEETSSCTDAELAACDSYELVQTSMVSVEVSSQRIGFSSQGIVVDNQGRLVFAGHAGPQDDQDVLVLRFTADGEPDRDFGIEGRVRLDLGSSGEEAKSVSIDHQTGDITVIGNSGTDAIILRLDEDGTLDPQFGTDGIQRISPQSGRQVVLNGHDRYQTLNQSADDPALLVGGQMTPGENGFDFYVASLLADGRLNTAFGADGHLIVDFAGADEFGNSPHILSTDGFLFSGSTYTGESSFDCAVLRYDRNGAPVSAFGTDGKLVVDWDGGVDRCPALHVFADSGFVAAGYATTSASGKDLAFTRRSAAGERVETFGEQGEQLIDLGADEEIRSVIRVSEPANRVVGAGFRDDETQSDFVIALLREDGSPDTGVGPNGVLIRDVADGSIDRLHSVAEDGEGLLFLGSSYDGLSEKIVLLRMELQRVDGCSCE